MLGIVTLNDKSKIGLILDDKVLMVPLDPSAAYDTIDHGLLN